ncbi:hypothetical protein VDGL01_08195 [Verticillium dahliae]
MISFFHHLIDRPVAFYSYLIFQRDSRPLCCAETRHDESLNHLCFFPCQTPDPLTASEADVPAASSGLSPAPQIIHVGKYRISRPPSACQALSVLRHMPMRNMPRPASPDHHVIAVLKQRSTARCCDAAPPARLRISESETALLHPAALAARPQARAARSLAFASDLMLCGLLAAMRIVVGWARDLDAAVSLPGNGPCLESRTCGS